ncbi:hypothetical protein CEXT_551121 [Caerostris extrusa]|uniref:Ribosomal protein L2 n=1 Tax=Caerostris extrusa TaxID=172846 RepID=A0AAV4RR61_CAEEX|nr:hypothetical protein CEXT_551121 [Caerostris extrusa]
MAKYEGKTQNPRGKKDIKIWHKSRNTVHPRCRQNPNTIYENKPRSGRPSIDSFPRRRGWGGGGVKMGLVYGRTTRSVPDWGAASMKMEGRPCLVARKILWTSKLTLDR